MPGSRAQHRHAFHTEVRRHAAVFAVLARRLTRQESDAEDALQSALTKAWQHYSRGEPIENFRAWVVRFLVHECLNTGRRNLRRDERESTLPDEGLAHVGPAPSVTLDLERELAHEPFQHDPLALVEQLDERLAAALVSLSGPERTVFLLRSVAELDYRQIAGICAVPVGTVMSRVFRAREKLRVRLGSSRWGPGIRPARDEAPGERAQ
ncbi:MAG: RNA polymerase sigma factor [Planctomycetota bacterium]|nr:MAG: RNA polymerase sigma factor [Planctomycetota bacterium]